MSKKKSILLLAGALLAVLTLAAFVGCEELGDAKVGVAAFDPVPIWGGQDQEIGEMRVWHDDDYLYIQYAVTATDWWISETHLHLGLEFGDIPAHKNGIPVPGKFTYESAHDPAVKSYTYSIPIPDGLPEGWEEGDCIYIAAHCVLEKWDNGELIQEETGWGGNEPGPGPRWWYWFKYCWDGKEPLPEKGSETAYGGDEYVAPPGWFYWFDWVVGTEGTATYDLWAGQWYDCGKVTAEEVDGKLRVTYVVEESEDFDWIGMTEAHLYYGECPMPYSKRPIPGQAPYSWEAIDPTDPEESYYFDLPLDGYDTGDCIYVIPHAVVWFEI